MLIKEELIEFEEDIAACFNNKQIAAPIHLYSGIEDELIDYFKHVEKNDWVLSTWRSHYQCLLHGVPKEKLKSSILSGKSISLSFPEHKILCSAIVGGIFPIAIGLAMAIKRKNQDNWVHVFAGDMSSQTGSFHECNKYACNFDLPITFIVEDNNKSVCTDTKKTWNYNNVDDYIKGKYRLIRYDSKWPHAGSGSRIQF